MICLIPNCIHVLSGKLMIVRYIKPGIVGSCTYYTPKAMAVYPIH